MRQHCRVVFPNNIIFSSQKRKNFLLCNMQMVFYLHKLPLSQCILMKYLIQNSSSVVFMKLLMTQNPNDMLGIETDFLLG